MTTTRGDGPVASESPTAPATSSRIGPPDPLKPLLRGWFHAITAPIALLAGLALITVTPSVLLRAGVAVYLVTAVLMFGNSGVYHRVNWVPETKQVFRRMDHSFIFVFIAGTYTPLCLALLHGTDRVVLLTLIWVLAIAGLLFRIFWLSAPRALYTAMYILMGWAAVWWLPQFWRNGGALVASLVIAGGLVYTAGAVAYAAKRPNPWPRWFGFHEIFHLCTVIAAMCHFAAIALAIL